MPIGQKEYDFFGEIPPSVDGVSISTAIVGTPGTRTFYYWVVAKFPIGNGLINSSNPRRLDKCPDTLSISNYLQVSWKGVNGATGYDLIRSTNPNGLIAGALTLVASTVAPTTTARDNNDTLSAYTLTTTQEASGYIRINNQDYVAGARLESSPPWSNVNTDLITFSNGTTLSTGSTGASLPSTTNLIAGDGAGNGVNSGIAPSTVVKGAASLVNNNTIPKTTAAGTLGQSVIIDDGANYIYNNAARNVGINTVPRTGNSLPTKSLDVVGNVEVTALSPLGSESLNEGNFATTTKWTRSGDFAFSGGAAVFTFNTGTGAITQTSGNMAIAGVGSAWYKLTYDLVCATPGDLACYVTTAFASISQSLVIGVGNVAYFKSTAVPGSFIIQITGTSGGPASIDNLSLKQVTGGTVSAGGGFFAPAGVTNAFMGPLGVGTMSPSSLLEVYSSSDSYPTIRITSNRAFSIDEPRLQFFEGASGGNYLISEIGANVGNGYVNSQLTFRVANASQVLQDRMVIDKTGNVGIGTTPPLSKLMVNGSVSLGPANTAAPTAGTTLSVADLTTTTGATVVRIGSDGTNKSPVTTQLTVSKGTAQGSNYTITTDGSIGASGGKGTVPSFAIALTIPYTHANFKVASTVTTFSLDVATAKYVVLGWVFNTTTAYAGTAVTSAVCTLGDGVTADVYGPGGGEYNMITAGSATRLLTDGGVAITTTGNSTLTLTCTSNVNWGNGANTVLTQGSLDVYVMTAVLPTPVAIP
jgi:hypothetical protein